MCKKLVSLYLMVFALTFFVPESYAYTPDKLFQNQVAGIVVEAPQTVHDGRAFLVNISVNNSVPSVLVDWLGKTYSLPVTQNFDGEALCTTLLPVPLDTKSGEYILKVEASSEQIVSHRIAVEAMEYPVQSLTVEPKYVKPPQSVLNQIARDRKKVLPLLGTVTPLPNLGKAHSSVSLPLTRPVQGIVTSPYGVHRVFNNTPKGSHLGLDLRGASGTPIHACADGRVVLAEELYYAGNAVYIDHGLGVVTAYMHMSAFSVKEGDMVKAGDELGKVGMTGRVTGPHLHLSVYVLGTSIDPLPLLQEPSDI